MKPRAEQALQTVLVLQGGGALGAYQAGVYEGLTTRAIAPDWVVGTSIGAINGAIIAGNPPERRVEKLQKFWRSVTLGGGLSEAVSWPAIWQPWLSAFQSWQTIAQGVPGFFTPRSPSAWDLQRGVPIAEVGFYDTTPLRKTLLEVIDFDYLNAAHTRLTISAVAVASAEMVLFDNTRQKLGPEQVMASGALPPGFPPVVIDSVAYWDGGIYSNTPIDIVLDDAERRDTLCFMIDLWDPTEAEPHSIAQAMTRMKDIQYASRSREHLSDHETMQNLRRAVQTLYSRLDASARSEPELRKLASLGCRHSIDIVHLVMKASASDDHNKDIDFSAGTLATRWQSGLSDIGRALRHSSWIKPDSGHLGLRVHELEQVES